MTDRGPRTSFAQYLHAEKYRAQGESFEEAMHRIASALSDDIRFRDALLDMRFMPAGRIQAAVGSPKRVTPFNCFVSGTIEDSFIEGSGSIMKRASQAAQTMRMGGGIGYDFSTLRPRGAVIKKLGSVSSGPIAFMGIFDAICKCIASSGHRRGAQMGILRVDHPDIEEFIHAKQNSDNLTGFNVSIAVTDEFMGALQAGSTFDLRWNGEVYGTVDASALWEKIMRSTWDWAEPGILFIDTINRQNNLHYCEKIVACNPCFTGDTKVWTAEHGHVPFQDLVGKTVDVLTESEDGRLVYRTMSNIRRTAQDAELVKVRLGGHTSVRCTPNHRFFLKDGTVKEAQDLVPRDEVEGVYRPGTITIHSNYRVSEVEWLEEREDVYCGTVDDPTHRFFVATGYHEGVLVANCAEQSLPPNGACLLGSFNLTAYLNGGFDWEKFRGDIPVVVEAMDRVIDVATFPLYEQEKEALSKRRMGLGITGLANAGETLGFPYGSEDFLRFEANVLRALRDESYRASAQLAKERGPFPLFDEDRYLEGPFIKTLPADIQADIRKHGIRNSHLTSIAPTGTISLCADNVSSGIEPVFSREIRRTVQTFDGPREVDVVDFGYAEFGTVPKQAAEVMAEEHLQVLAVAQKYVDSAVSKTCNVSPDMPWAEFKDLYEKAWEMGCKGLTTFNSGGKRMGILAAKTDKDDSSCRLDPETGRSECE